jgi:hypothetical protein
MAGKFAIKMVSDAGGRYPLVHEEREVSFNDLLRLCSTLSDLHGHPPVVEGKGVGRRDEKGNRRHFRYAWESPLINDRRATIVLWVRVISWN